MLRTTVIPVPPLCNSMSLLNATQTNAAYSLAFTSKARLSFVSGSAPTDSSFTLCFKLQQFRQPHVNLNVVYGNGLGVGAMKKFGQGGGVGVAEMEDFDEDDDYDVEDVGSEEDEGDDDEGVILPFEEMRKWMKNKPRGFGEGKVYDTFIEDKLVDEILKSTEAQAANVNKLKNNPIKPGANKNDEKKKAKEAQSGVRVRLVNLPKKKNIHRDLKSAFQGIPGIVDIIPAVSGNKKTRDPVCKGFAFVDFKFEEDATRFVQLYSGQTISFGKTQKHIKCELLNVQSSASASLELSKNLNTAPQLMVPAIEESVSEDSNTDDSVLSSWDGTTSSSDDSDHLGKQTYRAEQVGENQEFTATLNVDGDEDDSVELPIDSKIDSLSLEQLDINLTTEQKSPAKLKQGSVPKKKPPSKEKAKKVPKLDVPGSSKKLKIKEKALLSDVFSKYGLKAALASKHSS